MTEAKADGVLQVVEARMLNPITRLIRLRHPAGEPLPAWTPGAHIKVQVALPDGTSDWRHYSLIDLKGITEDASPAPSAYTIAVRREEHGRGGSAFMHQSLRIGDLIPFQSPTNNFSFEPATGRNFFVAGGIGITPLTAMLGACVAQRRPRHLYYAGRSRASMAFLQPLETLLHDEMTVHADDEQAGAFFQIEKLMDSIGPSDRMFLCGPKPMLDVALALASDRQWAADRLRFELFTAAQPAAGDHAFEIVLSRSGKTLVVPANQSILDCLIQNGFDPLYDCKRGECGVCTLPVLEGEIDHRDYFLSTTEKASGKMMQVCVSRAKGNRLVLDY